MSSGATAYGDPATRTRILEAARALLEEQGIGITLADVASRAGVSRQAVYLHFGDRSGLFIAVGDHIDVSFGRDRLREYVFGAPSGVEGLRRWVETMSWYTAKIDSVSRIIERGQDDDEALAAIWKDRMTGRRGHVHRITLRIAADGQLADQWSVEEATDLVYAVTLPGPWRVMTGVLEWSEERYSQDVMTLLEKSLLKEAHVLPAAPD